VPDTETVHLLGAREGHNYLAEVYDAKANLFRRFIPYLDNPPNAGKGTVAAVIDTGLLSKHPVIRARLIDAVDFTGEGVEDENGHGTMVALILLRAVPDASLIDVKALKRDGTSSAEDLLKALRWVRITVVNLSAGVYRPDCRGHCSICEAARRVVAAGKSVSVAAGNLPGITACPAKASDSVIAVAAADATHRRLASYSSPAPGGIVLPADPIPAEWVDREGRVPILIPAEWADREGNLVSFVTRDGRDYTAAIKALSALASENPAEWVDPAGGRLPIPVPFDLADQGGQPGGLRNGERAGPDDTATDPPCSGKPSAKQG
jgi:hypothetical protein